jgi:integrase
MAVGKTRKTNKHLPRRMYQKHGAFWYVDRANKWHPLGADYGEALKRYAALMDHGGTHRVDLLIARYENEILPKRAPDTAKGRKKEFKSIRKVFGHMDPQEITAAHAWSYFTERGSNQAARHEIRALSAVLGWARKWGALGDKPNPLHNIGFPTFKPRDRYVTDEEFLKVRSVAPPMVRYAMNIALATASRQKDILGLDRRQVAAGVLQVTQSKTGKRVNFPIAGSLEENIEAALKIAPQVRQLVIVNRKGKRYTRDGFQTQWKRAMTKAFPNKEERFTFNDIRAKSLSDAETLEEARIRAGHADTQITQRVYRRLPEVATVADLSRLKPKSSG